ncbi:chromodomain Y-like protein [Suncus etruscus]|uniref:chromodomain Y-like protein n=1 Tax=Suncus etruscus TaxID=109475 RepID=UPI0021103CAD|nr:chromodomain Y-like protein [Suncus etruscus]
MDGESLYEVERIAAERHGPTGQREYLVQWKGYGRDGDTWEPEENMVDCAEALQDFQVWRAEQEGGALAWPAEEPEAAGARPESQGSVSTGLPDEELEAAWEMAGHGDSVKACDAQGLKTEEPDSDSDEQEGAPPLYWGLPRAPLQAPSTQPKDRGGSFSGLRIRLRTSDLESEAQALARDRVGPWKSASVDSGWDRRKASPVHVPYRLRRPAADRSKQPAASLARFMWRKSEDRPSYRDIVVRKQEAFTHIILFSRSSEKNCLHPGVMKEMQSALTCAAKDNSKFVLLGAAGSAFCGGLDLAYLSRNLQQDQERESLRIAECLKRFVSHIIQFSKPIVVAVNGPAQGLGVAILALCDIVWSSDSAWFQTPYIDQGQTPDGCSSLTLPKIMGGAAASEMFFTGRKLTAQEACDRGLVSQVFKQKEFYRIVLSHARKLATSYPLILEECKNLMRCGTKAELEKANARECDVLKNTWAFSPVVPPVISALSEHGTQKRAQKDTLSLY